jgi:hypothetical protein
MNQPESVVSDQRFPGAWLDCYLGPLDGDRVAVAEGQWRIDLLGGYYQRCSGLSGFRGESIAGECLLWYASASRPAVAPPPKEE